MGTVPVASGQDFTLQHGFNPKKALWKGAASGEAAVKKQR